MTDNEPRTTPALPKFASDRARIPLSGSHKDSDYSIEPRGGKRPKAREQAGREAKLGLEELADHALLLAIAMSTGPAVPAGISKPIDQLSTGDTVLME
jgi:hypothetical protein